MKHEVVLAVAGDAPLAVMELHMVPTTEQDAAVDVGAAAFAVRIDVMRFAVGGRSIAVPPPAPAVADGESNALFRREKACLASEVERVAPLVERACHRAGVTGLPC